MVSNSLSAFRCDAPLRASGQIFIIDGVGEASKSIMAIDRGRRRRVIVLDILFTACDV
jgi:hypothetical protein